PVACLAWIEQTGGCNQPGDRTMKTNHMLMAVSILGMLGAASVLASQIVREAKRKQTKMATDRKLDEALDASMDCSDAVASY
ncbi:hypothetical protein ACWTQZ_25575, partial [Escherichia coli]